MRFHHSVFAPLHFDFGTMLWPVKVMPTFSALFSIVDHRDKATMHNIAFYAFLKVLTKGKCHKEQAQAIFDHLDLAMKGEVSYSEMAFFLGIVVAHKDHIEREFLYMNAWKMWVTFNESGTERLTTRQFRKTGLFFDFDYPTIYAMFKDYNWDDEKHLEFERFRFYLISCIHFRQVRKSEAKFHRFRQFKHAVLELLKNVLTRVLTENVYPSPLSVLKAVKTIKIPAIEGTERSKRFMDILDFSYFRNLVAHKWDLFKIYLLTKMANSCCINCCCQCMTCGLCCCRPEDSPVMGKCDRICDHIGRWICCSCRTEAKEKRRAYRSSRPPPPSIPKPVIKKHDNKEGVDIYVKPAKAGRKSELSDAAAAAELKKQEMMKKMEKDEWAPVGKPGCRIL